MLERIRKTKIAVEMECRLLLRLEAEKTAVSLQSEKNMQLILGAKDRQMKEWTDSQLMLLHKTPRFQAMWTQRIGVAAAKPLQVGDKDYSP